MIENAPMKTIDLHEYREQDPIIIVVWMVNTFGCPGIRWNFVDLRYVKVNDEDYTWFTMRWS